MSEAKGDAAKTLGNDAFKTGDYTTAIIHFTEAIELEPANAAYYSNRSAAYLKSGDKEDALKDGKKCVELKADWGKGYSRQGAALIAMGEYAKAITIYALGLANDPSDTLLTQGLASAQKAMAGGDKKTKKKKKKKKAAGESQEEEVKKVEGDVDDDIDHVIGIDLGTTYSCVGVWEDNGVKIISNTDGARTIPSYVSWDPADGTRYTGMSAKNQATRLPTTTVFDVKRIIGQGMDKDGVQKDISKFPFAVTDGGDCKPQIEIKMDNGDIKKFAPEEISAMVLQTCKGIAEKYLGKPVKRAVITVPAYFNDAQRNATKAAGIIADLEVMRIINEPTAAALAYGLDNKEADQDGGIKVLIFDLGGGTFDVSILSICKGIFTVLATGGDTRLGGEDFDNHTIDYLLTEIEKAGLPSPKENPRAMQRLKKAAEVAKRELSSAQSTEIRLDDFINAKNFKLAFTRQKFEQLNKSMFTLCMETVKRVLKDAKLKTPDIDELVLVGGSTRIPKIQSLLTDMFSGKHLNKSVNPDEAVAFGAAVQGAILNGRRNDKTDNLLLMDVTPLSLGIETTGRVMSVIIPRNTPIPVTKTQTYTTEANYQTKVDISVYEGERLKSDENNLLGEFTISGIESAKRGEPQVDVSFSLDSNGILNVVAKDQTTGSEAKIEIANRSRVTSDEIEKMVEDAAKFKREDQERIRKVEAKNELEATIFEVLDIAKGLEDVKLADVLSEAADKEQVWLDDNYDDAKASEVALRRRQLARRIENRKLQ